MPPVIPEDEIDKYLTAFADGELGTAGVLAVLEHLADNPEAMRHVIGQQRLRLAAAQAVRASTPAVPDALRQRIAAAAAAPSAAAATPARDAAGPLPRRHGARAMKWLLPLAAAACVAVGVSAGRLWQRGTGEGERIVPPVVAHVTRVHVGCSRLTDHSHAPDFPREASEVAPVLHARLGTAAACPDLSAMGYEFAGAGPCDVPGAPTVHLLYRPRAPDLSDAVSVFLQRDVGQVSAPPGEARVASAPDAPHPVRIWRGSGLVCYLVADDARTADAALAEILAARTPKA